MWLIISIIRDLYRRKTEFKKGYKPKTKLVSRCQKAGQKQSIKIGNMSFESVGKFKYLRTTLTE
jgi:hypothetical protein